MLAHFYHVYADGAWQDPLAEHLAALEASGLGAALDVKAAGVVGSPGELPGRHRRARPRLADRGDR